MIDVGATNGQIIFGTFDENNNFSQLKAYDQSSVTLNSNIPIAATFLTNGDSASVEVSYNGVTLGSFANLTNSLAGSVGLRTIKSAATYTQCKVSFNVTGMYKLHV